MADLDHLTLAALRNKNGKRGMTVERQPWGYVIRSGNRPPMDVLIGQIIAYFFGVCFVTAGLGLLILPGFFPDTEMGTMRIGAATLFCAGSAYLLWFASRGGQVEVQIDRTDFVIREVIPNRVGKPTVLAAYAFADIGGVFLETAAGSAPAQLVLGYRGNLILVAEGEVDELTALRTQLSRDLLGPMEIGAAGRLKTATRRAPKQQAHAA